MRDIDVVGFGRRNGDYDYAAAGDKGQYTYISPANRLVIVRHGIDYGIPSHEWMALFFDFASQY